MSVEPVSRCKALPLHPPPWKIPACLLSWELSYSPEVVRMSASISLGSLFLSSFSSHWSHHLPSFSGTPQRHCSEGQMRSWLEPDLLALYPGSTVCQSLHYRGGRNSPLSSQGLRLGLRRKYTKGRWTGEKHTGFYVYTGGPRPPKKMKT